MSTKQSSILSLKFALADQDVDGLNEAMYSFIEICQFWSECRLNKAVFCHRNLPLLIRMSSRSLVMSRTAGRTNNFYSGILARMQSHILKRKVTEIWLFFFLWTWLWTVFKCHRAFILLLRTLWWRQQLIFDENMDVYLAPTINWDISGLNNEEKWVGSDKEKIILSPLQMR